MLNVLPPLDVVRVVVMTAGSVMQSMGRRFNR